jgi:hypothetical protein
LVALGLGLKLPTTPSSRQPVENIDAAIQRGVVDGEAQPKVGMTVNCRSLKKYQTEAIPLRNAA